MSLEVPVYGAVWEETETNAGQQTGGIGTCFPCCLWCSQRPVAVHPHFPIRTLWNSTGKSIHNISPQKRTSPSNLIYNDSPKNELLHANYHNNSPKKHTQKSHRIRILFYIMPNKRTRLGLVIYCVCVLQMPIARWASCCLLDTALCTILFRQFVVIFTTGAAQ